MTLIPYTKFTPEMKSTHKILIPQMAPIHFELLSETLRQDGYDLELLRTHSPILADIGQQYVHNDACYPATLVIGQMIDALKSGHWDESKIALLITQTGGGCRASNYLAMLRKALHRAGYSHIPVASLNFSGLEKDSSLPITVNGFVRLLFSVLYGDELMWLANQTRPYEAEKGQTDALVETWIQKLSVMFKTQAKSALFQLKKTASAIAKDFASIRIVRVPKPKVGVVGEIYVKYAPVGNNNLEAFLRGEGCEVVVPGLFGFIQYCIQGTPTRISLYGGSRIKKAVYESVLWFSEKLEETVSRAIKRHSDFRTPTPFHELKKCAEPFIGIGADMGEGWLLTAEMVDLVKTDTPNIICTQPFGCLPNHVVGKAMIPSIRAVYPQANIMPIDYDPSASRVNQENRIKLMLSAARAAFPSVDTVRKTQARQETVPAFNGRD